MSHGFEGDFDSQAVADELEISAEDVEQYVTIERNESDDGNLYGYDAVFSRDTPLEIRQAAGAGDSFMVRMGPNVFDEEE